MGVGESSLVDSVAELSEVLDEVEKKITQVEAAQIHLERTVAIDGEVLVCEQRILCNPSVGLALGPVVGLVSQTSARILLETSKAAAISLYLFLLDEITGDASFVASSSSSSEAGRPICITLTDLKPGCRYAVYPGGCCAQDTLVRFCMFATLPSNAAALRVLFTHQSFPLSSSPGDGDTWTPLMKSIAFEDSISSFQPSFFSSSAHSPHIAFHLGGFVSAEAVLRSRGLQLFDLAARDDVDDSALAALLELTEEDLRHVYRQSFMAAKAQSLLRGCSNVFICGEDEAALRSTVLLAVDSEAINRTAIDKVARRHEVKNIEAKRKFPSKAKSKEGESEDLVVIADHLSDFLSAATGVHRDQEVLSRSLEEQRELQDEARKNLVGILLRIARRVYWAYMRQLWDESYSSLAAADLKDEAVHRTTFYMERDICRISKLCRHMEITTQKLVKEFGSEYAASQGVKRQHELLESKVYDKQKALREYTTDRSNATGLWHDSHPSDVVLDLGVVIVLLVDSNWNWLLPSGLVKDLALVSKEVALHVSVFTALEKKLVPPFDEKREKVVRQVLCLSPTTQLPLLGEAVDSSLATSFFLAAPDLQLLFKALSRWQQEKLDRQVLIACASKQLAGSGYIAPLRSENDLEGWHPDRSKLTQLAVGGMVRRPEAHFAFTDKRNIRGHSKLVGFESIFSYASSEKSFWSAQTVDVIPYDVATGEDANASCFRLSNVTSSQPPLVIAVGPIIGQVTATSAVILLESASDAFILLQVIDQVTSKGFELSRFFQSGVPGVVYFDGLDPGRSYQVTLYPGDANAIYKRMKTSKFRGSFTTSRNERVESLRVMEGLMPASSFSPSPTTESKAVASYPFVRDSGREPFRLLLLGTNRPSWSHSISNLSLGSSSVFTADFKAIDRHFLLEGAALCRDTADICSRGFAESVDLVLHLGCSVDLTLNLEATLSLISEAEVENCSETKRRLLATALSLIRDCYRIHWGASSLRSLLANSSHMFVSCTMLDLLSSTNSCYLKELERDLSPFALRTLYDLLESARKEYQANLWSQPEHTSNCSSVSYAQNGNVCIFTLQPKLLRQAQGEHFASEHYEDHLISEDQFRELEELLFERTTTFSALLLVSPLPIIRGDPDAVHLAGGTGPSVRYCKSELVRLLDILTLWIECTDLQGEEVEEPAEKLFVPRDVLFIVGGSTIGYRSVVEARRRQEHRGLDRPLGKPDASIQQICCGAFISIPDAVSDTNDDEEQVRRGTINKDSSFAPRSRYINSNVEFTYLVIHSEALVRPHCGIVDISIGTSASGRTADRLQANEQQTIKLSLQDRAAFRRSAYSCPRELSLTACTPRLVWQLWSEAAKILKALEIDQSGISPLESLLPTSCSSDLKDCLYRVKRLCEHDTSIMKKLHDQFCAGFFGNPFDSGHLTTDVFHEVASTFIAEVHSSHSELDTYLLASPSPFMVTCVYVAFRNGFSNGNTSGPLKDNEFDAADKAATSSLQADLHQFALLVHRFALVPIIFETLSYPSLV